MSRRRLSAVIALALVVTGLTVGSVSAEEGMTEPPPDTTVEQMMAEMTIDRAQMMAEITAWVAPLPGGVGTLILDMLHHWSDDALMMLHYDMHHTNLLQQPPGQIYLYVHNYAHASH